MMKRRPEFPRSWLWGCSLSCLGLTAHVGNSRTRGFAGPFSSDPLWLSFPAEPKQRVSSEGQAAWPRETPGEGSQGGCRKRWQFLGLEGASSPNPPVLPKSS